MSERPNEWTKKQRSERTDEGAKERRNEGAKNQGTKERTNHQPPTQPNNRGSNQPTKQTMVRKQQTTALARRTGLVHRQWWGNDNWFVLLPLPWNFGGWGAACVASPGKHMILVNPVYPGGQYDRQDPQFYPPASPGARCLIMFLLPSWLHTQMLFSGSIQKIYAQHKLFAFS